MLTMKDLRKFVADHSQVDDNTVLLAAEADPSGDFDNSGLPITSIAHDHSGSKDPGDLGLVYLLANGIEEKPKFLEQPLTVAEASKMMDQHGEIRAVIAVGLDDLIDHDIEGVNDLAESAILSEGILSDIRYRVVGYVPSNDAGSGDVLIEVTAEADTFCLNEVTLTVAERDELAEKFVKAGYGDYEITDDDMKVIDHTIPECAGWEEFCQVTHKAITGSDMPKCTLRGRGFRSQYYGKTVADAIRKMPTVD